ncbi:right-handed parallel beta-helix repeat-containing protein [Halobacterium wangiae]|uniref:right-handed parallel beta-helix repeat-containing protein n=1 Tax=Halobacterium wangiae TaxID=2902623 RepID=UPI001E5523D1|nr:right-handed parallel beta-helix repeat-containing protein [Halobacterium wangiae]
MAKRHNDDETQKETSTDASNEKPPSTSRRTFIKTVGAAAAIGGSATLLGNAKAAGDVEQYLDQSGNVTIPAGEYSWSGSGVDVGSGDSLVGEGNPGDVVWNLESGTMDGSVRGTLENIVVRGDNPQSKAGLNLYPGSVVDGFVWPEGGGQGEDRAFYHPDGGSERTTVRNSAIAWMANNGAYTDKAPATYENVAAVNNNIANIRVGHRESAGTSNPMDHTTYIRNCLVAVTQKTRSDYEAGSYARGIRMRYPGNFVIENCYVVYLDVEGTADLVEIHDEAPGANVEIRNCHFHNDSDGWVVRDKTGGDCNVTIEDCTFSGSGNRGIQPDYSGNGLTDKEVTVPLPSEITGYAVADEIEGVGSDVGPFGSGSGGSTQEPTDDNTTTEYEHTLVLHGDPENPVSSDAVPGDFDLDVVVSGEAALGEDAESNDGITAQSDGTTKIDVNNLGPDELDSFRFNGRVVDYALDDGYDYTVALNGVTTTFEELVAEGATIYDESTGKTTDDSTDDTTTDDSTDTGGSTGGSTDDTLPHRVSVFARDKTAASTYTFTVSGDVTRDATATVVTSDGNEWDELEDIANDGQVVGIVGSGVDSYRFSGEVENVTVNGDAEVAIYRDV